MIFVAGLVGLLALVVLTLRTRSRARTQGAARDGLAAHARPLLQAAFPEEAEAVSLEWCAALWRAYETHAVTETAEPDTGRAFARLAAMEADPAAAGALRARYAASVEALSPPALRARLHADPDDAARRIYEALAQAAARTGSPDR